jgi:predicted nucleic-acid-binding protein
LIALDTSVLARFVLGDDPAQQHVAARLIADHQCYVTWSVLLELCWVFESNAGLPREQVVAGFVAIRDTENIALPDADQLTWIIERYAAGADFPDMVHLASASIGATEFACFDKRLSRHAGPDAPLSVRTLSA